MTGFELQISDVDCNCSANCTTATADEIFYFTLVLALMS